MIISFGQIGMSLSVKKDIPFNAGSMSADIINDIGGSALLHAVSAARSGAKTCLIGAVGNDIFGKHIVATLRKDGIQTSNLIQQNCPTQTIIHLQTHDGSCSIFDNNNAAHIEQDLLPDHILNARSVLLLCNDIPSNICSYVMKRAKNNKTPVILSLTNPQNIPDNIMDKADIIILHPRIMTAFKNPHDENTARFLSQKHHAHVISIHDMDFRDIFAFTKDNLDIPMHNNAAPHAIDYDACFESFCGNIAACFQAGFTIENAIIHARAAATLTGKKKGGYSALPYLDHILDMCTAPKTETND